ncbi:hypothetical protein [Microvirga brassicacearum]|uniref:Uncharacterized protein n=1 Tax=Microvirga brassicacearum TaxID=2580413 RepID=A0A5N3PH34_9HYPH|nr:hypothetical protein [Microvirga brassicacearum]KAB0269052.1 hypothetical protein FEZ63_02795 [Microvirga brassicacearum]
MSGIRVSVDKSRVTDLKTLIKRLEGPEIRSAAARGLNEHVRLQERQAVRLLSAQTKIPAGRVAAVTKSVKASASGGSSMEASVDVRDASIPLGQFTYRSWSRGDAGASAGDWNGKTYKGSFTIAKYGGAIFARRPGAKKWPVIRLWGPLLPSELRRADMPTLPAAQRLADTDLERRVLRHLVNVLGA